MEDEIRRPSLSMDINNEYRINSLHESNLKLEEQVKQLTEQCSKLQKILNEDNINEEDARLEKEYITSLEKENTRLRQWINMIESNVNLVQQGIPPTFIDRKQFGNFPKRTPKLIALDELEKQNRQLDDVMKTYIQDDNRLQHGARKGSIVNREAAASLAQTEKGIETLEASPKEPEGNISSGSDSEDEKHIKQKLSNVKNASNKSLTSPKTASPTSGGRSKGSLDELENLSEEQLKGINADELMIKIGSASKMSKAQKMLGVEKDAGNRQTMVEKEFLRVSYKNPIIQNRVTFLKSIPILVSLSELQLAKIAINLFRETFDEGEFIIKQGDPGNIFYLIESGDVNVHKVIDDSMIHSITDKFSAGPVILELTTGDFFGERALLKHEGRAATCVAAGNDVIVLGLHREHFEPILSDISNLLNDYNSYQNDSRLEVHALTEHSNKFKTALNITNVSDSPNAMKLNTLLMQMISAFSPGLNMDDIVERFVKIMYGAFSVERIGLFTIEGEEMLLKISKDGREMRMPIGGLAGAAVLSKQIVNVRNAYDDSRFNNSFDIATGFVTKQVLAVPVMIGNECVAVLQIINKKSSIAKNVEASDLVDSDDEIDHYEEGEYFTASDEWLVEKLVEEFARVMQKMRERGDPKDQNIPQHTITQNFKFRVTKISELLQKIDADAPLFVSCGLWHGGVLLRDLIYTVPKKATTINVPEGKATLRLTDLLEADIKVMQLPRATRLIFTVLTSHNKDANIPLGWTACYLFDYQGHLCSGSKSLKLWPGSCPSPMTVTSLENTSSSYGTLIVEFERYGDRLPVKYSDTDVKVKEISAQSVKNNASKMMKLFGTEHLLPLIEEDQLYTLTDENKNLLYSHRMSLLDKARALPKVLLSVDWSDRRAVMEIYALLHRWEHPTPIEALQLLDAKYPDPKVRAYAVECLEKMPDADLKKFMLQLTQVLKFEPFDDSALARFLIRRSLLNTQEIGQLFFWHLKAEMHVADVHNRFGILLEQYLRNCGEHRTALGHQVFVLQKLDEVAMRLSKSPDVKADRLKLVKDGLFDIVFPSKFRLPLLPEFEFSGVNVDKCRYMNSKKLPLWLDFKIADPTSVKKNVMLMYKTGDDLRQDQLTLQIIRIMDDLWKKEGLDLRMNPYGCVSTGDQQGMLEIVQNSETIGGIIQSEVIAKTSKGVTAKLEAAKGVLYETGAIKKWLETQSFASGAGRLRRKALENENDVKAPVYHVKNGLLDSGYIVQHNTKELQMAAGTVSIENFARSCAGYCVATYVLGIGDRHNDNIMLTRDGKFFHIDFGHFLGNFKSKYGVKRERATFVFTPHFAEVLGGVDAPPFKHFVNICQKAFNILRKHRNMLITLFSLMLSCGIPELQEPDNILYLRNMLMPGATDDAAANAFAEEIVKCMNTKTTLLNDVAHVLRVAG